MRYRLPLELELVILELAAPPLVKPRLFDRVDFFINISLVHRSLTAWAQERLHDQFLYTYRPREDEDARLERRLEAGFGRGGRLRRFYLDLSRLPGNINSRQAPGTDSVSATVNGRLYRAVSSTSGASGPKQTGARASKEACEAVAHYVQPGNDMNGGHWELCRMITTYAQALDTLWLRVPYVDLNIKNLSPPRVLYIDSDGVDDRRGWFGFLPVSSDTTLFLRYIRLEENGDVGARHLIFDGCWSASTYVGDVVGRFSRLETLILSETEANDLMSVIETLPSTIRRVHILLHEIHVSKYRPESRVDLPHLEFFTFTWLLRSADNGPQKLADDDSDELSQLQQVVESRLDAPQCTFKYLRSTKSPKDALADALSTFKLDL